MIFEYRTTADYSLGIAAVRDHLALIHRHVRVEHHVQLLRREITLSGEREIHVDEPLHALERREQLIVEDARKRLDETQDPDNDR